MRITFFTFIFCYLLLPNQGVWAQQGPGIKNAIAVKFLGIDHFSPLEISDINYFEALTYGGEITYLHGISKDFNLAFPLRFGKAALPISINQQGPASSFWALDATLQFQPLIKKSVVSPYALAGIGGFLDDESTLSAQIPLGLGVNVRIVKNVFIQVQSEYRIDFNDLRNNFMHGAGLMINIGGKGPDEPKDLPPPDSDGDGIADADDQCPPGSGPGPLCWLS